MKKKISAPNRVFIKGLKLNKFKAFGSETTVKFSPMINLIFGKNSTGKSSILQALRLFRQSYSEDQLTPFNLESPEKYKENGGIDIDIQYRGIVTDNNEKNKLALGVETGVINRKTSRILDEDKLIQYEYKYDNNFYKKGDQLIKDKVLLNGLKVKNKKKNINFELEFSKAIIFDETGNTALQLSENSFGSIGNSKNEKIYKSLYSPYYYEIKLKDLEINNLDLIHNEFLKKKDLVISFLKKFSSFILKDLSKMKELQLKEFDKDFKTIRQIKEIKDDKNRIAKLKEYSENAAKHFIFRTTNLGFKEYSKEELSEVSKELKNIINFLNKSKNFYNFKKMIIADCKKKIERHIFYKGRFSLNPDNKFKIYRSRERYNYGNIEDRVLYMYDFIIEALNYYSSSRSDEFQVLEIMRSYNSSRSSGIFGGINGGFGSAYSDLNLCMEKMFIIPGLRSMPKRYFAKGVQTSYVGARAENLAESLANPAIRKDTNRWLKKLEIPYSVKVKNVENHYEIIWLPANKKISIFQNHIGLGYPLILPFIVQCLTAKNNIIVVEEPEVHLHPKLQADLGDLIVWSALNNDNQIILETHSEDLLLRVLKKIRKKEINPEFVSANYVLKKGNKPSEIKKIKINSDGQYFTPWKDDIFAERLKEFE
jgi:predicted ATPase